MVRILGNQNSILNQFIAELRDINVQNDFMRFRRNLERCGEIFAYELSKELNFQSNQLFWQQYCALDYHCIKEC